MTNAGRIVTAIVLMTGLSVSANAQLPESVVSVQFYKTLETQINTVIGTVERVSLKPVSTARVGDFPYFWKNENDQYNFNTLDWINHTVVPGPNNTLMLSENYFTDDYVTVLGDIGFKLSTADQLSVGHAQVNAAALATKAVKMFESAYGPINQQKLQIGQVDTPIDYVVDYKFGRIWSCYEQNPDQNSVFEFHEDSLIDFDTRLRCMPTSGQPVLDAVLNYFEEIENVAPLKNQKWMAPLKLRILKKNATRPSATNGGITVIHDDGTTDLHTAYTIRMPVTEIQNHLDNVKNKIEVHLTSKRSASGAANVSLANLAPIEAPLHFLNVASDIRTFNPHSFRDDDGVVDIKMTFPGYVYVPISPSPWMEGKRTGWYSERIVREAVANVGQDITGFQLQRQSNLHLGKGGEFGRISGVLISRYPTITMTYDTGDMQHISDSFDRNPSWSVKLFGATAIGQGGVTPDLYRTKVNPDTSGRIVVTMMPAKEVYTVTPLDRRTYVLAVSVEYPGAPAVQSRQAVDSVPLSQPALGNFDDEST